MQVYRKFNKKIHLGKVYLIKYLLSSILGIIDGLPFLRVAGEDLVVINYHSTPKKYLDNLEAQIRFFVSQFNIIGPKDLVDYFNGKLVSDSKPFFLITFDDGLKNNMYAIEVLNKYNIKAILFVIPDFIDTPVEKQKQYYGKNIRRVINTDLYSMPEDFTSLSWNDLKTMYLQGHEIGSHSKTHSFAFDGSDEKENEIEIVESKMRIAEKLKIDPKLIRSFCSPINSLTSVGPKEIKLIKKHYQFLFSTIVGSNYKDKNPYFIKRVHMEPYWQHNHVVKYSLGKLDRLRWISQRKKFQKILKLSNMMK